MFFYALGLTLVQRRHPLLSTIACDAARPGSVKKPRDFNHLRIRVSFWRAIWAAAFWTSKIIIFRAKVNFGCTSIVLRFNVILRFITRITYMCPCAIAKTAWNISGSLTSVYIGGIIRQISRIYTFFTDKW